MAKSFKLTVRDDNNDDSKAKKKIFWGSNIKDGEKENEEVSQTPKKSNLKFPPLPNGLSSNRPH